jgi:hypothetical protein
MLVYLFLGLEDWERWPGPASRRQTRQRQSGRVGLPVDGHFGNEDPIVAHQIGSECPIPRAKQGKICPIGFSDAVVDPCTFGFCRTSKSRWAPPHRRRADEAEVQWLRRLALDGLIELFLDFRAERCAPPPPPLSLTHTHTHTGSLDGRRSRTRRRSSDCGSSLSTACLS